MQAIQFRLSISAAMLVISVDWTEYLKKDGEKNQYIVKTHFIPVPWKIIRWNKFFTFWLLGFAIARFWTLGTHFSFDSQFRILIKHGFEIGSQSVVSHAGLSRILCDNTCSLAVFSKIFYIPLQRMPIYDKKIWIRSFEVEMTPELWKTFCNGVQCWKMGITQDSWKKIDFKCHNFLFALFSSMFEWSNKDEPQISLQIISEVCFIRPLSMP